MLNGGDFIPRGVKIGVRLQNPKLLAILSNFTSSEGVGELLPAA
jgi:hypothetical protein